MDVPAGQHSVRQGAVIEKELRQATLVVLEVAGRDLLSAAVYPRWPVTRTNRAQIDRGLPTEVIMHIVTMGDPQVAVTWKSFGRRAVTVGTL
jgi:hypothetical protein